MLLFFIIAGCTPSQEGEDSARPESSDPGWELGQVEACAAPLQEAAWTDRSSLVDQADAFDGLRTESGSLALAEVDGGWFLATDYPGQPRTSRLDGSAPVDLDPPFPVDAVEVEDLDADGRVDLLLYGDGIAVQWSLQGEVEVLVEPCGTRSFFDLSVADFDGDGLPDMMAAIHPFDDLELEEQPPPEVAWGQGERSFSALAPVEVEGEWGAAFDLSAMDWDADGRPDVYVCNDGPSGQPDRVLCSRGRTFEACDARGADVALFCMGVTVGDLDSDGLLDLYLTASEEHRLLLDSSLGFVDSTAALLDVSFEPDQMGWGAAIVDLDNDGLVDLLSANGDFTVRDGHWPLWVFMQEAPGQLIEQGEALGFPQEIGGRALITRDLNQDGVLDLLMADMERPPWLWLSDGCTDGAWLEVEAPPQSVVRVEAGDQQWSALVTDDPGYAASAPPVAHVGLGTVQQIDRVLLQVPGQGEVTLVGPLEPRRRLRWAP